MRACRNVVLIVADEVQADVLPAYGGTHVETPGLDRLAREGTVFEAAYCNAPVCTPSRYSMLTGRRPWSMGSFHNQSPVPSRFVSLAGLLAARGVDTVGIGKMHFKGDDQMWGYARRPYGDFGGLSHQPDPLRSAPALSFVADAGPADIDDADQHDVIVGDLGCAYLREHDRARPFFLHLSFNFPHYPLRPPRRLFDKVSPRHADLPRLPTAADPEHPWMRERRAVYRELLGDGTFSETQIRRARAAYYACTELVDEQISRVLAVLDETGFADDTLVISTADHGEMLGEHDTWEKNCFYEQSVRVPLLVRGPGDAAGGRRVADVVELVDLFPTVADLSRDADVAADDDPSDVDGESLAPLLGLGGRRRKDYAISELAPTYVEGVARMARRGNVKYVAYDAQPPSVFDLERDPDERVDLGLAGDVSPGLADEVAGLAELADTDFVRVQAESRAARLAVHPPYADMVPNQYRADDGALTDAETFYDCPSWSAPARRSTSGVRRVRPDAT